MIKCRECGASVSSDARACLQCGSTRFASGASLGVFLVCVLLGFVLLHLFAR